MKNFLKLVLLIIPFVWSCSDDESLSFDEGPVNVGFADYMGESYSESNPDIIEIIVRNSRIIESPTTVNFTFSTTNLVEGENFEFISSNSSVVIPANEKEGKILLKMIDDIYPTIDARYIDIKLVSVDGRPNLGQEQIVGLTNKRIFVTEDDCPLDLSTFVGTYTASENNGSYGPYDVTVEVNAQGTALLVTNLWDVGATNTLSLNFDDPANPYGRFSDGEYLFTHPTYGDAVIYNSPSYTSTFSTCTNAMDLYFAVCVSAGCFTGFDGVNHRVELTKQ